MNFKELAALMRQQWPFPTGRDAVLRGYRVIGVQHRHVLADIALRNHVFSDAPAGDAIALAIAEGRRRAAIEILKLADCDYDQLWALVEKKPKEENRTS